MKKTVIITGSNGSLGYELAKRFDKQNFNAEFGFINTYLN